MRQFGRSGARLWLIAQMAADGLTGLAGAFIRGGSAWKSGKPGERILRAASGQEGHPMAPGGHRNPL
jgi:hypothetical protein